LGFGVWGTPRSRDRVGGVMLVLRTFPELVWRSVQTLVEIGLAVREHRKVNRYKQALLYIQIEEEDGSITNMFP